MIQILNACSIEGNKYLLFYFDCYLIDLIDRAIDKNFISLFFIWFFLQLTSAIDKNFRSPFLDSMLNDSRIVKCV